MRFRFLIFAGAIAANVLVVSAPPARAQAVTPEMFGSLPNISEAEISPDGKTVATIQNDADGFKAVAFYDLTGANPPRAVRVSNGKLRDLRWVDSDHAIALISDSKTSPTGRGLKTLEIWRWLAVDKAADRAVFLNSGSAFYYYYGAGELASTLPDDAEHILLQQWFGGQSLFRVKLKSGDADLVEQGDGDTIDWVVDASGEPQVRIDYNEKAEERRFFRRKKDGGRFEQTSALAEKLEDDEALIAYASAGSPALIHEGMRAGDYLGLHIFDAVAGKITKTEAAIPSRDIEGAVADATSGAVVGVWYTDDLARTRFIDPELQNIQSGLEKSLPGAAPVLTSWSTDRSQFFVRVDYSDHPPQYFIFDRPKKRLSMFGASYKALDGKVFAAKERYDYTASDGLSIRGYLTAPARSAKKLMPLVVLPHGGPWERDDQSFDYWSFFYAARGYLVYQPNFRGSSGYGTRFREAGYGQFGRKMQDDITEGVKKLVADGLADPKRICIVGASYGGYAALAGAALTPDLYACAVSINGISNIPQIIADTTDQGAIEEDWWNTRIGNRVNDVAELRAVSPEHLAAAVKAPILLIHGKDDTVVPIGQSRSMRNALEKAKKEVHFVELAGEDHWLSGGATRTQMLRASIEFIDKHIGKKAN